MSPDARIGPGFKVSRRTTGCDVCQDRWGNVGRGSEPNGPGAAQSVSHFHLHILPRWLGDGLVVNWTPKPGDHARIAEIAERIRRQL